MRALPRIASPLRAVLGELVRCAGASFVSWACEMAVLTGLVSGLGVGAMHGAMAAASVFLSVNFLLNRHYAFRAADRPPLPQLLRNTLVAAASYGISLPLYWLAMNRLHLPYAIAWMAAGTTTFFVWTFPLHRAFTYARRVASPGSSSRPSSRNSPSSSVNGCGGQPGT